MFAACQVSEVGSRDARCVPNERLSAVLVSARSNEYVRVGIVRSLHHVLLDFPELACLVVRVGRVVTELVAVDVLTGRAYARGERVYVADQSVDGRAVRLFHGAVLAADRNG